MKPELEYAEWSMPSKNTFSIRPIRQKVRYYLRQSFVSVDPFAKDVTWTTWRNDLNPKCDPDFAMEAEDFLGMLVRFNIKADLIIFDPPYSLRQTKECYESIGLDLPYERTLGWGKTKDYIAEICTPGGIVISCGWNSIGMGIKRGFDKIEIMLVCHGRHHNDTIVTVERKRQTVQLNLLGDSNANNFEVQRQRCPIYSICTTKKV